MHVYRNLHKNLLSIRHKGLIEDHRPRVRLLSVKFRVQEAGRLKVIAERRKNVHAYAAGILVPFLDIPSEPGVALIYDPYRFTHFVRRDDHRPVLGATACLIDGKEILAYGELEYAPC